MIKKRVGRRQTCRHRPLKCINKIRGMKKATKLSMLWFYELLERGECDIMDFKLQLEEKEVFGKSLKNYSDSYDELARDAVAFANNKGGGYSSV